MKIRKVKWKNHPILGNLELNFLNASTNEPYDTIVFAGENGTGKSTILDSLSTFLNIGSFEYFEYLEYTVNGRIFKASQQSGNYQPAHKDFFQIEDDTGTITPIRSNRSNNKAQISSNNLDPRHYGCILSKARADYKTQIIKTASTSQLDVDKYDKDIKDDFTSLKQLIIDVENQDNSDYTQVNKNTTGAPVSWSTFYPTSKLFRFKNAFDSFFQNIEYEKVANVNNIKDILFKKNNNSISIDKLSTGEKQIVFRGIYLLKNSKILIGSVIMVDEPELSMHPKWQRKILKYYKSLFLNGTQLQVQLFLATHSEWVLKEALPNNIENLVITLREQSGVIVGQKIDTPTILPTITSAETSYIAFDIISNDFHIELYGYLQDKESKHSINSCDNFIKSHVLYDTSKHQKPSSHGTTTYDTLSTYIRNAIHHPDNGNTFTEAELKTSIELLIELCR